MTSNSTVEVWTEDDWAKGLCVVTQIGTVKAGRGGVTVESLIADAERVYEQKGNVAYLKQNQRFLRNVLLTGLKPAPTPAVVVKLRTAWQ